MKKLYCPTCHKFKNRFQVKKVLVRYDTCWFECRWCHNLVETTENIFIKMEEKINK